MKRLTSKTKENVFNLFLTTVTKRIIEVEPKEKENPCYMCMKRLIKAQT
jgi:hypothetical protein